MPSFLTPWWQRNSGVLERERQSFDNAGMEVKFDETARPGQMVAHVIYQAIEREIHLDVIYPPLYPQFRPDISAGGEKFDIHQNPVDKRLCMTGNRSSEWYQFETAAELIEKRMPELLSDNDNEVGYRDGQAAPISNFFHYSPNSAIIVDGAWTLPGGVFDATVKAHIVFRNDSFDYVRGTVSDIRRRKNRTILRKMDDRQGHRLQHIAIRCPLLVVQTLALIDAPNEQLQSLCVMHPVAAERNWVHLENKYGNLTVCMFGISFNEEVAPGRTGLGYQFFLIVKTGSGEKIHRIRAQRGGRDDIGTRVPQVQGLRHKTITLNGAGAIGSPAVLEFARNGVDHLLINDSDYFDIATSPRWALGLPSVGGAKSAELMDYISAHFPRTKVTALGLHIGSADIGVDFKKYMDAMTKLFDHTNIIVDFSAEIGVQNFLHHVAMEIDVPFVFASATNGAEGGLVGRFMPGSCHGCWYCLQCALQAEENDLVQYISAPNIKDDGDAFPAGCTHPTFTGAGFDLQEVSLQAVRMTTQSLLEDNADSIVARLSFAGKSRIPVWEEIEVMPRPECATCRGKTAISAS